MYTQKSVVVIGAGLGGIATAARLAQQGHRVTVVEKNDVPGGRCGQFSRDGHRFDIGATLFLMPEIFEQTYAALDERMSDHLDLIRIDPTYHINFDDDTHLALTSDLHALETQLEAIEPGSFSGLLRYLDEGRLHYHKSVEKFVGRNFDNFLDYFSPTNLPLLIQLKPLIKHYWNIGRYFRHPYLKAAFTFQNMYLGLSPFDAPATYSLLQYTEMANGVWFPRGGVFEVVRSLVKIAEASGVQFVYNAPVSQIEVKENLATGVILEDGRQLSAEIIVANADLPYVYSQLLPDKAAGERLERKKYTCSTIMFYWGVNKIYPELGMHNVFLSGDYRASFDSIFNDNTLPEQPSFYVHAPARVDPTAAPQGEDTLFVLVPVGHLDENGDQDWETMTDTARSAVLERLERFGVKDLEASLKFEVCYSPQDWAGRFNLAKGAAFGLSHNFMQVGYLRPQNQHKRYKNLYFTGSSTHPGTGLPMVLLSARLTTERILADHGARQPQTTIIPVAA